VEGVVGRPGNWTGAKNVEWQSDRQPQREALGAAPAAGLVERRFHGGISIARSDRMLAQPIARFLHD
jgi:hypothetical protein